MNIADYLLIAAILSLSVVGAVIGFAVILDFGIWAARTLWDLSHRFKNFLSLVLVWSVNFTVSVTFVIVTGLIRLLWELIATTVLALLGPVVIRAKTWLNAMRARMAAKRRKVLEGVGADLPAPTLAPVTPAVPEPVEPPPVVLKPAPARKRAEKPAPAAARQAGGEDPSYTSALAVLGFKPEDSITSVDLKMRYNELAKKARTESDSTSETLPEQLLQARDTIKRAKGWA